jgi:GxxExxY protein
MPVLEIMQRDEVMLAAAAVHDRLGKRSSVERYEAAMSEELSARGIEIRKQSTTRLQVAGMDVGAYLADFFIDGNVLIEIKRATQLTDVEKRAFADYLGQIRCRRGYLVNFAADRPEVIKFAAK